MLWDRSVYMEPLDFYRRISRKSCESCGTVIKEQAESYTSLCEKCLHVLPHPTNK